MATATDPALTLMQWFSPAFPVGGFHFSHGLEQSIDAGQVCDKASLQDWVEQVLTNGAGRNDAILIGAAYRAVTDEDLREIDDTARALASSRERLIETVEMGGAFARATAKLLNEEIGDLSYPVAVGRAASAAKLPLAMTAQFYLHAFTSNLASVGMRLIPLGQTDGQAIIADLAPVCSEIASNAVTLGLDELSSICLFSDIAAMRHETQYSRMFRT